MSEYKTSVSFRIAGDTLKRDEWTSYFKIKPLFSYEKGEVRTTENERCYPIRVGIWCLNLHDFEPILDNKLLQLLKILGFPREDFKNKLAAANLKADMFCYWEDKDAPVVSPDIITVLDTHNIILDIDSYEPE